MSSPVNIIFSVTNQTTNTPVTGLSLSFSSYTDITGSTLTPPSITELGNGTYKFAPIFPSNSGIAYSITTAYAPPLLTDYTRPLDWDLTDNTPKAEVFSVFKYDLTPATGLSLSFSAYENNFGVPLSQPIITEVGNGFYSFIPAFPTNAGIFYSIITTYSVVSSYLRPEDFVPIPVPVIPSITAIAPVIIPALNTVNFGQDTYDLTDLPLTDTQIIGKPLVALRLARRYQMAYGSGALYGDDPDMGCDLSQWLNAKFNRNDIINIQTLIEQEALKDEQVQDATALVQMGETGILKITISVITALGPFLLTIPISGVTYKILFSNS